MPISPLLAPLALAVRLSNPRPVMFRQERLGYRGHTFEMLKFRSIVDGAEAMLPGIQEKKRDAGNDVPFKLRDDPRVTPIGRIMRRYSLHELPQLYNVLAGSISPANPRPSLLSEMEKYEDFVHRRFLVKPGARGLWQVSGRSILSRDESVRLDLSYVENSSLLAVFVILANTVRTVLRPGDTAARPAAYRSSAQD